MAPASDGTPRSAIRDDSDVPGRCAQPGEVFLAGCGLPAGWADQPRWHILDTGFGMGLNFLAAWHAWRQDPARPQLLQYTAIAASPAPPEALRRAAAAFPELAPLADQLAAVWRGLLPGLHRLVFEQGQLQLTLCVGQLQPMLREIDAAADTVYLGGFSPGLDLETWDAHTFKAVARLCRRGTHLAGGTGTLALRAGLAAQGFKVRDATGHPPKAPPLEASFDPHWQPRGQVRQRVPGTPGRCVVIGAGLAGSAVAASLARRGWQVTVLDAGPEPAAGASGLPAGIVAPHVSPDDNRLSRLTRAGVRATLQRAAELLTPGTDWQASGVLEHCVEGKRALPTPERWPAAGEAWSRPASDEQRQLAGLQAGAPALWHATAGWLRPWRLVQAQLALPGIRFQGSTRVAALGRQGDLWQVRDDAGRTVAEAEWVVLAAGYATLALLQATTPTPAITPPLNPLRGQITQGTLAGLDTGARAHVPAFPVNGFGNFVADGDGWYAGATFERNAEDAGVKREDHVANHDKMKRLLPAFASAAAPAFAPDRARGWAALRCTLPDRVPAVGPLDPEQLPGLCLLAGLGARGISLSVLCGELLAAWLQGEPLPVEQTLARSLQADRWRPAPRPTP